MAIIEFRSLQILICIISKSLVNRPDVHIHAVEIKVSKHDLLSDHKMQEYTDYADFFWIAVPEELKADAESIMLNDWGLITIDKNKELHVIKKAELHDAIFRDQTVETALIKIL